jgi:branched-chain amino acid transport system ATP-binding protein
MAEPATGLEVDGASKFFGGLRAVDNVSFGTRRGEIFGIIGPNGAGKSTLFNLVTGTLPLSSGRIRYRGQDITGLGPEGVAGHGIIRTFQSATVFKNKTVRENVRLGCLLGRLSHPARFLNRAFVRQSRRDAIDVTAGVLAFCGLQGQQERLAGELAYGLQKTLGVAMAIAAGPTQLLMDEPAAGLNPIETEMMGQLIRRIRDERGIDVVLVEHDMPMVMSVCDRILVLNRHVLAVDTPQAIQRHPDVIEAYLGADIELHPV